MYTKNELATLKISAYVNVNGEPLLGGIITNSLWSAAPGELQVERINVDQLWFQRDVVPKRRTNSVHFFIELSYF